jgi:cell wall-associated NlpC family hydrolase
MASPATAAPSTQSAITNNQASARLWQSFTPMPGNRFRLNAPVPRTANRTFSSSRALLLSRSVVAARAMAANTQANRSTTRSTVPVYSSSRGAAVVAAAARLAGAPYVYGAAGPYAFDCSGLTMYVYRQFGVYLPHHADAQKSYGRYVSRANARPGDLVVFLSGGYGYHVGIYAGGNMMWDAPVPGQTVGKHQIWGSNTMFRRLV